MDKELGVLVLEADPFEADSIAEALREAGIGHGLRRVQNREAFIDALHAETPDLVLADYGPASRNGFEALAIARLEQSSMPFIIMSQDLDETAALEAFRMGATDWVLKDRPALLAQAVERAMRETAQRTMRQRAQRSRLATEEFMAAVVDSSSAPMFVKDSEHRYVLLNDAYCRFMGAGRDRLLGKTGEGVFPKEQTALSWEEDERVLSSGQSSVSEIMINCDSGAAHTIDIIKTLYTDRAGKSFILGTFSDITAHKRLEHHLREIRKLKSDMASMVGHDFGDALSTMRQSLHLLETSDPTPRNASRRRFYQVVLGTIENLKTSAANFLDLHRLEAGRLPLDLRPTSMPAAVREALAVLRPLAEAKDISMRLQLEIPEATPLPVCADAKALGIIIRNLIADAVKSTPDSGAVTVQVSKWDEDGTEVLFSVANSGTAARASGVGLLLVKELLEKQGSSLEMEGEPGQGSRFFFRLPSWQAGASARVGSDPQDGRG
jgi:PAS domain S-box-containing protein